MTTDLLGAKVNNIGVLIYSPEPAARKVFFEAVYETPAGQEFLQHRTPEAIERLTEVILKRFPDEGAEITVDAVVNIIEQLIAVRDPALFPPEPDPAAAVEDTRQRNPDGTFKNSFQIFTETHSARECADYARENTLYGEWRREQMRKQSYQDSGLRIAGAPTRTATPADHQALSDFVKAYNAAPAHLHKPRAGRITLDPSHSYTPQQWEQLVTQASNAGLL